MSCRDDIKKLIQMTENAITNGQSVVGHWNRIYDAISQCDELGDTGAQNKLALIIDDHLENLHRHAEPKMKSLDELEVRKVPQPKPITWRH